MKKIIICKIVCIAITIFCSTYIHADPLDITFAFEDKESFPYYMGTGDTLKPDKPGASVEVIQFVADKLGLKIKWKRMPWKRCLSTLQSNRIDGTFNASYKPEREKFGVYPTLNGKVDDSRRLVTVHYSFYKMKKSNIDWNGKTLINFTGNIGVVLGYSVENDLRKRGFPVDAAPNTRSNINKLLFDRVRLIAGSKSQIDSFLNKDLERNKDVVELKIPLKIKSSYLILSHDFFNKNKVLSEKLWDTIGEFRTSKQYQIIFEKYY